VANVKPYPGEYVNVTGGPAFVLRHYFNWPVSFDNFVSRFRFLPSRDPNVKRQPSRQEVANRIVLIHYSPIIWQLMSLRLPYSLWILSTISKCIQNACY